MYVCMYVCTFVCMYVCMYMHECMYIHVCFRITYYYVVCLYVCVCVCLISLQTVSANSSQTDLYAVVDKKKKISAPNVPPVSTRPVRKHDYEDINDEDLPAPPPQYHAPPMSTRPFRRHDYEDIPDENLPPLPPHHHTDVKPNGNVPPKIPAPYHSSSNSTELKVSSANKKMANLHSSSFDTSTDPLGTRYVVGFY